MRLRPQTERQLFNEVLGSDFVFFAQRCFETLHSGQVYEHNWHIDAMAWSLHQSMRELCPRLLITMPPRHMKSLCVSVAWPAFLLARDPSLRILLVSYGQELASANLRLLRQVMDAPWYRAAFPNVELTSATQTLLTTGAGGKVHALSTGGVITGFGGDYIIFDDPMKQSDAVSAVERAKVLNFYQGSLTTRLNDPRTSRIVIVMQRVHADDLAHTVTESGAFQVLNLCSIASEITEHQLYDGTIRVRRPGDLLWPERFTKAELERKRQEMGDYEFALQFQQSPIPIEGGLIRISEIQRHAVVPTRDQCELVVQSLDTAFTEGPGSDYSVIGTFGYFDGAWRLLDVHRAQLRYPDLLDHVRALRSQWRPDYILVETVATGLALFQELQRELRDARTRSHPTWQPVAYRPTISKVERMAAQSARLRDGHVTLPETAPWLMPLLSEIEAFPNGRHDDQVDMLAQFLDLTSRFRDASKWGQRPAGGNRPLGRQRR